jgi:hypothetical protein
MSQEWLRVNANNPRLDERGWNEKIRLPIGGYLSIVKVTARSASSPRIPGNSANIKAAVENERDNCRCTCSDFPAQHAAL